MGNSHCQECKIELNNETWKPYCQGCYQRKYPHCDHCKRPIHTGQEKISNYHKECYSLATGKCCVCLRLVNRHLGQGIYCTECYDVRNPPPLRMNVRYQGAEFNYYSRDDRVLDVLAPIANNMVNVLEGRTNQQMITAPPREQTTEQRSYWNSLTSYFNS
ncbi:uncharacterized protein LOC144656043 [Oculina patagonica]